MNIAGIEESKSAIGSILRLVAAGTLFLTACASNDSLAGSGPTGAQVTPGAPAAGGGASSGAAPSSYSGSLFNYPGGALGELGGQPLIADYGFRPNPQGFGFPNYGQEYPEGFLTAGELRRLFGDQVCASIKDNNCQPGVVAHLWMEQMNKAMAGGHCEGMAVLSLRFYVGQLQPSVYDPQARAGVDLKPQNTPLLHRIAGDWVTQAVEPVVSASDKSRAMKPSQILDTLFQSMWQRNEYYTIAVFQKGKGGHAMTPFGITGGGNGVYRLYVYDNNWPGTAKYVEFNTKAETWTYPMAAVNPAEDASPWTGDANTRSMEIRPLSSRSGQLVCPFCLSSIFSKQATGAANVNYVQGETAGGTQVLLTGGGGQVEVTDDQGRRAGNFGGDIVNEIPGARLAQFAGVLYSTNAPLVILPPDTARSVRARGTSPAKGSLGSFSPGQGLVVRNVNLDEQDDVLTYTDDGRYDFQAGGDDAPTIQFGLDTEDGHFEVILDGAKLEAGEELSVGLDPDTGALVFNAGEGDASQLGLMVVRVDETGSYIFANGELSLDANNGLLVDFLEWPGEGPLDVGIDSDGDGEVDSTLTLEDEGLDQFQEHLGGLTEEEVRDLLDEVGSYASVDELVDLFDDAEDPGQLLEDLAYEIPFDELPGVMDGLGVSEEEEQQILANAEEDD